MVSALEAKPLSEVLPNWPGVSTSSIQNRVFYYHYGEWDLKSLL